MKKLLFITLALGARLTSIAQPGAVDLSFDPGAGFNKSIYAVALQPDGKIIAGGGFTSYQNKTCYRIARLHANGMLDTTFQTGTALNEDVRCILVQPDGKIIAGGDFLSHDSIAANRIARLNIDGSLDTSFHTGSGFNSHVNILALQNDGKIIAGGWFTDYDGLTCQRLARLNTDGSYDTTFNTISGADGSIETMEIQPDGKIVIGGDFTSYDTVRSVFDLTYRVARVNPDGSRDTTFKAVPGASATVFDVALQPDGNVLIGGNFTQYNFQFQNRLARLHHDDGGLSTKFYVHQGADDTVNDIELLGNGNIIFGGAFTSFNDTPAIRLAIVDTNCYLKTDFNVGTGPNDAVGIITVQPDGKIIIAGAFTFYNGISRIRIARLFNCITPQPGLISGNDSVMCPGSMLNYSIAPVPDADSYEWTLPAGWTGASDSASITIVSNGQGGMISVRAFSDSCGFSIPQTKTIYRNQPPEQPICLVTVDDSSTHNILIWEKTRTNLIDSFLIYRETSTNVYTKIASVPYDSLSEYHDYGANPNITSYRYKLSAIDTCGVETAKSPFHSTIHLQNLGTGNFQWTFYQIENTTNPVTSFNVYRDAFGNGNFFQIGNIPGTNSTFTDNSYASFPNSVYVVDVNWGIECTPQRASVNTTRSNIRKISHIDIPVDTIPNDTIPNDTIPDDTLHTSIKITLPISFEIYPNPAENTVSIRCSSFAVIRRMQLFNAIGKTVWGEDRVTMNGDIKTIPVGALPKGVYFLSIETHTGTLRKKVLIQ